jgi:hypothetical protein
VCRELFVQGEHRRDEEEGVRDERITKLTQELGEAKSPVA